METVFNPVQTNQMSKKDKIKNLVWGLVNSTVFRITPPYLTFFRKFRIALLRMFGAKVDWNVSIHPKAKIEYPWNLTMRNLSSIGENAWIYAMAPIEIEEKTCVGKEVYLLTGSHDISSSSFDLVTKPIYIHKFCWLATGVAVMGGVSINEGCVVSANSVVVKDIEPWTVVGGNPAKFIKKRVIKNA